MLTHFRVKNLEHYQHYRDRRPTWIKLYNDLLEDMKVMSLDVHDRWIWIGVLLLSSRYDNCIEHNPVQLQRLLGVESADISRLIEAGLVESCAPGQHTVPSEPDKRKEKSKDWSDDKQWLAFWEIYPRKDGKQNAMRAWAQIDPDMPLFAKIVADVRRRVKSDQWIRDNGQFIPHASTYLNQRRWDDGHHAGPTPKRVAL